MRTTAASLRDLTHERLHPTRSTWQQLQPEGLYRWNSYRLLVEAFFQTAQQYHYIKQSHKHDIKLSESNNHKRFSRYMHCKRVATRGGYSTYFTKSKSVHTRKGLALLRACHSTEIALAGSRRLHSTLAAAPVLFAHAVAPEIKNRITSPSGDCAEAATGSGYMHNQTSTMQ